jgi:citrate synthase
MLDHLNEKSYKPHPKIVHVLEVLFILHAEHELNCSTAAVRHLSSSGVDIYTAIAGAAGALYGPKHGVKIYIYILFIKTLIHIKNIFIF